MLCPALGMKGECFSGAFLLMQKQFLETGFFILLTSLSQNLSSGVSPYLLQLLHSSCRIWEALVQGASLPALLPLLF